jgi:hypothetical protein
VFYIDGGQDARAPYFAGEPPTLHIYNANVNIIFETTKKSRILIDAAFFIISVLTDRNLSNIYKILQII